MKSKKYKITEKVWLYPSESANWYFVSIPKKESEDIRKNFGKIKKAWGSIPVFASVGKTEWQTSLFPNAKSGGYILPLKAFVRSAEGIQAGDSISFFVKIGE